jgi:hypothetical protein
MEKEGKNTPSINKSSSSESNVKASIYECTDTKSDGGTVHTRIYCFETNRPIKK